MAKNKSKVVVDDPVVRTRRGPLDVRFTYEEWCFVRLMWLWAGQPLGEIVALYDQEAGTLGAAGLETLGAIVRNAATRADAAELTRSDVGEELLALAKTHWMLPYRKTTDSTDRVWRGTKMLGVYGAAGVPAPPKVSELPAFRTAHEKLAALVAVSEGALELEVVGPRFLAQRRRAGLA